MPASCEFDVVTGAFGYTGRYIAAQLLERGRDVLTLTGHPERPNPFGARVRVAPFGFDRPDELTARLAGAARLYNTYWVRFAHGATTFAQAIANTKTLVRAAEAAGVRRIVHISITNPTLASSLPYFRGKAELEDFIQQSRLSHAIIRPTVVFGREDILINNIAWLLRTSPVFAIPGRGDYRLQPVYVEDLAALAVDAGGRSDNVVLDAVGPEVFTFEALVRLIARTIGSRARTVHVPPWLALAVARVVGWAVGDVLLTHDELAGLRANLLVSASAPTCPTRLSAWLADNAAGLGRTYASELRRHFRR
ncbi:MAG: NAD(P)H-binding protein [Phycisphaerae bacterium]|nr:NAD(P)H-binding protein [Phycisphaerae bacterium]